MVCKPKFFISVAFLLGVMSTGASLFAQTKVTQPLFESLGQSTTQDKVTDSVVPAPEFSTLQVESSSVTETKNQENQSNTTHASLVNNFSGIPSAFISLGNRQPTYGIVVEKNIHRLTVFELQTDGNYKAIKSYRAITGKEMGDKKYSGDNRTPEGIYFVVGQKNAEDLARRWGRSANKYGPRAFVLDYPNIFDKRLHKTGFGIWIHGVDKDSRILNPFDTEGCVALTNKDVLDVSNYISSWETPVVIVDQMQVASANDIQDERGKVLNMLETWRSAWEKSDIQTYQNFYSDNFYSLGKTKAQWEKFKRSIAKLRDKSIQVQISEPKVLSFKNQLLVEFLQKYSSNGRKDFGRKFLYLRQEGDNFKIIAEKWYPMKPNKDLELAVASNTRSLNTAQVKN
jgi:murein L,D-transpeptidase YafK